MKIASRLKPHVEKGFVVDKLVLKEKTAIISFLACLYKHGRRTVRGHDGGKSVEK
jgi:hypothetical protein